MSHFHLPSSTAIGSSTTSSIVMREEVKMITLYGKTPVMSIPKIKKELIVEGNVNFFKGEQYLESAYLIYNFKFV